MKTKIIGSVAILVYVNLFPYACRLWRGLDWVAQYVPFTNDDPILISLLSIIFFTAWASLPAVPLIAAFLLRKSIPITFILAKFVTITLLVYWHYDNDLMSGSTAAISLIVIPIFVTAITSTVAGVIGTIEFLIRRNRQAANTVPPLIDGQSGSAPCRRTNTYRITGIGLVLATVLGVFLLVFLSKHDPLELKFSAVDGREVDVAQLRGKVVLVDFWATWCGPCQAEVPNVVAVFKKYHEHGFEVVGISLDEDKDAMLKFTKEQGMTWPQYFDGQGWENAISSKHGIRSIPAMWLIDKKGKVRSTEARGEQLTSLIEKLLAEQP